MRRGFLTAVAIVLALPAAAHVTPNVELVKKGDFVRRSLPGASKFFEKQLMIGGPDMSAIKKTTGWTPSEEDAKVYVGRDSEGKLVGTVALVWMPSEHGPVGVAVAFDPSGEILEAAVTDVGSEPLAWVKPLIERGGLDSLRGLSLVEKPDSAKIAPEVRGKMSRYYARVAADGVARAQALERVALEKP